MSSTTLTTGTAQGTIAPANYEELFKDYFNFVRSLCSRYGIKDDEDAASIILLKFYEQDFLAKFDGNKQFAVAGGKVKRTKFSTFLAGFVSKYVLQERDRQMVRMTKEPVRLETPVGDGGEKWVDVFAPLTETTFDETEYDAMVIQTYNALKALPIRGTRDLALVFKMIVEQVTLDGKVDRKAIALKLDVSPTAVCLIFADLRKALLDMGLNPPFQTIA